MDLLDERRGRLRQYDVMPKLRTLAICVSFIASAAVSGNAVSRDAVSRDAVSRDAVSVGRAVSVGQQEVPSLSHDRTDEQASPRLPPVFPEATEDDKAAPSAVAPVPGRASAQERIAATQQAEVQSNRPLNLRFAELSESSGKGRFNLTGNAVFSQWLSEHASTEKPSWDREKLSEATVRLQFARLVEAAALRSPRVRQARAQYEASLSDTKSVKGQRWPQVDITTSTAAIPIGGSRDDNNPSLGSALQANIVTPIYDFGRLKKTIHSYEQLADAGHQTYQAELQNSASQVSSEAIELIKNGVLAEISEGYVNRLGTLVEMLSDIVKVDTGRGSELTQAKARFLQAEANRDAILARIRDQELTLRKLVGDTPLPDIGTESWDIQPGDLERQLAMLDQHPLVLKASAETASAVSSAEAIKSSARPQLNWIVSKTTAEDALGRSQPWETRLGLSWAAFRGGSQRAQRQAALARAEAGRQLEEQQRLDLEYQIRGAEHNARVLFERADSYRALTDETEQVRRAFFQQWYHLGKRSLLDVLSAENEYHSNQINEVTSRFDGYRAVFDGHLSAGDLLIWLRGQ
jgi:outer membrane protein, adhesin transport system